MAETKFVGESLADDDYDESEDSDFNGDAAEEEAASSSDEDDTAQDDSMRPSKRRKIQDADQARGQEQDEDDVGELDSGDEATIRERNKAKRKAKKTAGAGGDVIAGLSDEEGDQGWRAKTRAMREREKDERKRSKLASVKESTIDVNKLWEEMNRPGACLGQVSEIKDGSAPIVDRIENVTAGANKDTLVQPLEEMITIKRTYKFAGEVHTEEKTVPKSSAEARLWLAQQESKGKRSTTDNADAATESQLVRRPLRRISRFDPNFNNLEAFKKTWSKTATIGAEPKGPRLNVVEKSKMDWAAHVDTDGLKEELDSHARAKEGYLSRMDFLNEVEAKREEEARKARLKG